MIRWRVIVIALSLAAGDVASLLAADDWPDWRGRNRDGIAAASNVPLTWSPDRNIAWKTPIPGRGHASPIVVGDGVFVVTCIAATQTRQLLRLDRATGQIIWTRDVLTAPLERIHRLNSQASSTPASDGARIFVAFLDRDMMFVAAYDLYGRKLWETRPGPFASMHGFCTCPLLYRDWIILNGDHDGEAYLAALRKSDGALVWKTARENKLRSYCPPIVVAVAGQDQLVLAGGKCTTGYDILTGRKLWTCDGPSEQHVATLVHGHGLIFSLGGYPERHILAIRKGGVGEITHSHLAWHIAREQRNIPYVPSPLLYGDILHVVSDDGVYSCFAPQTGAVLYRKRVADHVSSSLVGAEQRVYLTDDAGQTYVFERAAPHRQLAKNSVGEEVYASLAVVENAIFIRGIKHLFCVRSVGGPAGAGP